MIDFSKDDLVVQLAESKNQLLQNFLLPTDRLRPTDKALLFFIRWNSSIRWRKFVFNELLDGLPFSP
jgi:hypothetical protein